LHFDVQIKLDKGSKSLKEKLAAVTPLVEELRIQKEERMKQFSDIKAQIEKISGEISGYSDHLNKAMNISLTLEEQDLTLRNLNEYQTHLRTLQKEKVRAMNNKYPSFLFSYKHDYVPFMQSDRLNKVLGYVNEVHALCGVLGVDFSQTVSAVHPSLHRTDQEQSTNISDSTLEGLEHMIQKLKTERKSRFQKVDLYLYTCLNNTILLCHIHLLTCHFCVLNNTSKSAAKGCSGFTLRAMESNGHTTGRQN